MSQHAPVSNVPVPHWTNREVQMKINPDIKSKNKKIFSPSTFITVTRIRPHLYQYLYKTCSHFLSEGGRRWWSYRWQGRWVRGRSSTMSFNICKCDTSWIGWSVYWGNYRNYRICLMRQCDVLHTCYLGQNQVKTCSFQIVSFYNIKLDLNKLKLVT